MWIGVHCSDGCITKGPSDALRSVLASQSVSKLDDLSATSVVDLGLYFTLGVKSEDMSASSPVPLSARTPAVTPRPSSSRARVSNQCMSLVCYYLRQVNEVNGGDNVFVRCVCVCVSVCAQWTGGS